MANLPLSAKPGIAGSKTRSPANHLERQKKICISAGRVALDSCPRKYHCNMLR